MLLVWFDIISIRVRRGMGGEGEGEGKELHTLHLAQRAVHHTSRYIPPLQSLQAASLTS